MLHRHASIKTYALADPVYFFAAWPSSSNMNWALIVRFILVNERLSFHCRTEVAPKRHI